MNKKVSLIWVLLATIGAVSGWWFYVHEGAGKKAAPTPVPVTVAQAAVRDLPIVLEVVGRAEAYASVTIKSRVDGQVATVSYNEGQHVRTGDVLLRLDPADFEARLQQAEANMARDQAQLAKARADVARYVALKERGFVSEEKVSEVRSNEAALAAAVRAGQAAADAARLQLSYATLRAPFDGIVGARLVFAGSGVKINDTALAVVNRVRPLYVSFAVPEKHLPRLRTTLQSGPVKVAVTLPGDNAQRFEGEARFLDNAVDTTTGTIQMKATLANEAEQLTPGQFLQVRVVLDVLRNAIVVPVEAVQQGAAGSFLYVMKADQTVEARPVEVLATQEGWSAIGKNLRVGEAVVTDGQLRLTQGAKVQAKPAVSAPPSAPSAPSAPPASPISAPPAAK